MPAPGVDPAIVGGRRGFLAGFHLKVWVAGSSPAMTQNRWFYVLRLTAITFSLVVLACAVFAAAGDTLPARAQVAVAHRPAAPAVVPGFWDPRRRPERPDLARLTAIRFMTEVDYPPFNFAGP